MRSLEALVGFVLACLPLGGCGARSEIAACKRGQTRPCESFCGTGVQECVKGRWTPCSACAPDGTIAIPASGGEGLPVYRFDALSFFPIDGQLLGDEGLDHD